MRFPKSIAAAVRASIALLALGLAFFIYPRLAPSVDPVEGGAPLVSSKEDGSEPCQANLKILLAAIDRYVQEHDGSIPDFTTAASIQRTLGPYVKDEATFSCPSTLQFFRGNSDLSQVKRADIKDPATVILLSDSESAEANAAHRNVAYADGHIARYIGSGLSGSSN